ncbi:MAG: molybdate ABC transporter substrate-binding protein, partial [Anaerovoracaceae bacterium]
MKKILAVLMILAMVFAFAACGEKETAQKETITIAAAASLEKAFTEELIPAFNKQNPNIEIKGTYDASGKLQTQIEEGAAIDVFFSAATKQMNALVDKDLVAKENVVELLENKIVLIEGTQSKLGAKAYQDILKADTVAIGDPASVPAGQYA